LRSFYEASREPLNKP